MSGRITALEPQVKHAQRFNLYVDDQFAFGVSALIAARLRVGQTLSNDELAKIAREENFETAREKALRFLEPRPRSASEVRQHLIKKKIAAEVIDQVIARLTDAGLLDDTAFAKYWVENREQFKPRAARALRFELKRKGLGNAEIAEAVGEIDESESAYRAARARAPRWHSLERREFSDKLTAFLVRRGFGYSVAKDAAQRAWDDLHATDSEVETPH
ncbi:MAG: regulatory protein RecX [Chloroflexi bacterium]|nr:regulatory protein RecX [Chloroflexota bacterium]